ncbi:MAG: ArsR family transcriptional regulator [Nitrospirae bacterium]|nr:ArsR family transcriptional regulator [Magnetococcales bacterium]HAT50760.1 hypothetical protein [Alphaproteobacteria bacterium]
MSANQVIREERRGLILQLLSKVPQFTANEVIIRDHLIGMGCPTGWDVLVGELAWLDEQGLIQLDKPGGLAIAKITRQGQDAADGTTRYPGVRTPLPL